MIVEVAIAGHARTWTRQPREIAECIECGSRRFRRSKLNKYWYCKECNEQYPDGKPLFPAITCSAHGKQVQQAQDEEGYWCIDCEEEDFQRTYRQQCVPVTTAETEQPAPPLPTTGRTTQRITTSIKIDDDLWREVKHHCTTANLPIADYLERVIRDELRK